MLNYGRRGNEGVVNDRAGDGFDAALNEIEATIETLSFLTNTENRLQILFLLAEANRSQEELQHRLDVPRTTLRRNIVELKERRFVETDPSKNEVRLLPAGEIIVDASRTFLSRVNTATDVGTFLDHVGESLPVSTDALFDCDIILCNDGEPYAPVYRLLNVFRDSDSIRGIFPSINPIYVEQLTGDCADEIELIVTEETFRSLRPEHAATVRRMIDSECVQLFTAEDVSPYGVCLTDEHIVVEAYDANLLTNSVLIADATGGPVADWAAETVRSLRERATPVDGSTLLA